MLGGLNLDTRLWVADDPSQSQSEEDTAQAEALFYDQPARIAAAVQRVNPAQRGKTGVYFVGFAGDGDPARVPPRSAVRQRSVRRRASAPSERSVLLINDVEDRDSYPLASVAGLGQALQPARRAHGS